MPPPLPGQRVLIVEGVVGKLLRICTGTDRAGIVGCGRRLGCGSLSGTENCGAVAQTFWRAGEFGAGRWGWAEFRCQHGRAGFLTRAFFTDYFTDCCTEFCFGFRASSG